MFRKILITLMSCLAVSSHLRAADDASMTEEQAKAAYQAHVQKILGGIHEQDGTVTLSNGVARLELPQGYRYLNAADAQKIVVGLWGNPPQSASGVLGMIVPAGESLSKPESWAVVLTYEEDGYVSDHDADKINYNDLLKQMKEGDAEINKRRKDQGYPTISLVGWAIQPHYDKSQKALHWAKELRGEEGGGTLNYDLRLLGRKGVLSLNGVAGMERLKDVEAAAPDLLKIAQFQPGYRYEEYNAKTDKKAEYSLAGLVLGGTAAATVAAKAGLFKGLWVGILAAKKFVVIGLVALGAFIKKLFGSKSDA